LAALSVGTQAKLYAAGSDTIRIGLIGCGGRGAGAVVSALTVNPNAKLTAMAEPFSDRLQNTRKNLKNRMKEQVAVDDDHCFTGFDGYRKLIASGVDVAILASPPHFRPIHAEACVNAGMQAGKPINDSVAMARSTMLAILGRMATHSGQRITWEQALGSKKVLAPKRYAWDAVPPVLPGSDGKYPHPVPGVTKAL
jgi:hypothetical protein